MTLSRRLLLLPLLLVTACSGYPKCQFEFDAIDASENPRPCLIVIDDDWAGAAEKNQVVNVTSDDTLKLTLEFKNSEVEITCAPLLVEGNAVQRMPTSRKEASDNSGFRDEVRRLRVTDPKRELFILPRKTAGT